MNSTPESDQPVEPAEGSQPDDIQRVINMGRLPGLPTAAEEAEEEAEEEESRKARKDPTEITNLGDNADELTGFNLRMD